MSDDNGRPRWHQRARCRGVDTKVFLPGQGDPVGPAKALCRECEVREECLNFALSLPAGDDRGIWGGISERQRRDIRRERARADGA
jgi:WhiB family redox-sensing transcriptional regulator